MCIRRRRSGAGRHLSRIRLFGVAVPIAAIAAMLVAGSTQAHIVKTFGKYTVALGWVHEPTYVGEQNAVQVVIKDAPARRSPTSTTAT